MTLLLTQLIKDYYYSRKSLKGTGEQIERRGPKKRKAKKRKEILKIKRKRRRKKGKKGTKQEREKKRNRKTKPKIDIIKNKLIQFILRKTIIESLE